MLERLISLPPVSFCLEVWDTYARAGISRSAAALAYYLVLTLFPLVMCVNYFIGLFHFNLEQVLRAADALLPAGVTGVLGDYLTYVAGVRSPALLWASVFTILVSASAGLRTLFLALDELYGVRRPMGVKTTLVSVALSALFLVTIYFSVVVIFTGDWFFRLLERYLPRPLKQLLSLARVSGLWGWLRYLVLFCAVLLLVLALYRAGHAAPGYAPAHPALCGLAHRSGHGGVLRGVLLVHRHVLPLCPGIRLLGLPHHPAGVAVPVRQYPPIRRRRQPHVGDKADQVSCG